MRLLPNRFEQDDRHRRRQIQAASALHGNGDATVDVRRQQTLRKPFRLAAEYEKIAGLKFPRRNKRVSFWS